MSIEANKLHKANKLLVAQNSSMSFRISQLEARVEELETAINRCFEIASGRESEWGDRAESAFDVLYAVFENHEAEQS